MIIIDLSLTYIFTNVLTHDEDFDSTKKTFCGVWLHKVSKVCLKNNKSLSDDFDVWFIYMYIDCS